jgi:O-antigen/teichoic acid export membrane protein
MSYTRLAVKGASTVLVISIIAAFLGYLVRLVLAKNLSIEEFGLFYAVFAFLSMLSIFKTLGFDTALIKFIPEFLHLKKNSYIKSSIIYAAAVQVVTNTIIIIAIYLASSYLASNFFQNPKADYVLKIMAIAFFIESFILVIKLSLQGFKKMVLFAGIDIIRMVLVLALVFLGFQLNYGLISPIVAYTITPIILTFIFGFILIRKVFPKFLASEFILSKKMFKKIFKYGIFVMAASLGILILGYTDIMMLTYFSGLTAVAFYSVALPTAKILIYFPRAISAILIPLSSELWTKKKKDMLREGMESLYKYSFIVIVPLVLIMFSFADIIINVLFGKTYLPASSAMKILSIGMIFATINGICSNFFSGIGKPQIASKMIYAGAIFNLLANLVLIPLLGIVGAAITTTLSYSLMMLIGLLNIKKFIVVKFPIKIWIKTLIVGFIFTTLIAILKKVLVLNIWAETAIVLIISGIFYILLLFLFKIVRSEEIRNLHKRIKA